MNTLIKTNKKFKVNTGKFGIFKETDLNKQIPEFYVSTITNNDEELARIYISVHDTEKEAQQWLDNNRIELSIKYYQDK